MRQPAFSSVFQAARVTRILIRHRSSRPHKLDRHGPGEAALPPRFMPSQSELSGWSGFSRNSSRCRQQFPGSLHMKQPVIDPAVKKVSLLALTQIQIIATSRLPPIRITARAWLVARDATDPSDGVHAGSTPAFRLSHRITDFGRFDPQFLGFASHAS